MLIERVAHPGEEWDSFVRQCEGFTNFHLAGWERVNRELMRHETIYLEARCDSVLCGVLPLVRVRSRLFGHYMVSMPFVSHGGPLGNAEAISALVAHGVEIAQRSGVDLLELRSRCELGVQLPVSHRKVSVLLDLERSSAEQFKAFPAKLRSQIRRPGKDGVVVQTDPTVLGDFYRVFSRHMRDLGTPTLSRSYFEAVQREFGVDSWLSVAYLDGVPVAGGMGFRWGSEFEITWASALREYSRSSPNMAVYWSLIERAISAGCTIFNFGRGTPGGNTHRFKLQWGGRDEALHWYQWRRGNVTATPSPDSGALALGPKIWRRLPLSLTNRVGPHIVRLVP